MGVVDLKFENKVEPPVYPTAPKRCMTTAYINEYNRTHTDSYVKNVVLILVSVAFGMAFMTFKVVPFPEEGAANVAAYLGRVCSIYLVTNLFFDILGLAGFHLYIFLSFFNLWDETVAEFDKANEEYKTLRNTLQLNYKQEVFTALKEHCRTHGMHLKVLSPGDDKRLDVVYSYKDSEDIKHCYRFKL